MLHAKISSSNALPENDDRRWGTDRVAVGQPTTVRADEALPLDAIVEDLSSSGFLFRADARLAKGASVRVGLGGGGMAEARVVRVEGDRFGCEFTVPLSDAQLSHAFNKATVVTGAFPAYATGAPVPVQREAKLPGAARVLILAGGGALSWVALFRLGSVFFG